MRVYAKCVYGQEEAARRRIEAALAAGDDEPDEQTYQAVPVGRDETDDLAERSS